MKQNIKLMKTYKELKIQTLSYVQVYPEKKNARNSRVHQEFCYYQFYVEGTQTLSFQ